MEKISNIPLSQILIACAIFIIGLITARLISKKAEQAALKHLSAHQSMLIRRVIYSLAFMFFLISSLQQLGFHFSVLIGAAGIFTVAISFASQTSVSNLISGIFLLIERPFKVGDNIQVKNFIGKVHSIDLLSTIIVTTENKLVRLPNESLIKTEIINFNYSKNRRLDLLINIAYESDINLATKVLKEIIEENQLTLDNKDHTVDVNQFLDSSIELKLCIWIKADDLRIFKTDFYINVVEKFNQFKIVLPYPQIVMHKPN